MKKYTPFLTLTLLALAFLARPLSAQALSLSVEPTRPLVSGDTILLNVLVDTDSPEINVVDGTISFAGPYNIVSLNTNSPLFTLWPNKPSLSGNTITFTGGAVSGVSGKGLKLFSIALKPTSTGSLTITTKDAKAFLADGAGTSLPITGTTKTFTIAPRGSVAKDDLATTILGDTTPPRDFSIIIGQDQNLYDGKYFASFYTTDDESGINRYEVVEENLPLVRSGSTYVLQDQSLSGSLTVQAIDNAGNIKKITVHMKDAAAPERYVAWWQITLAILIGLVVCGVLLTKFLSYKAWKKRNTL